MNVPLILYALAGTAGFLLVFPLFLIYILVSGKEREGLLNRLGYYRRELGQKPDGTVRVWVHAASVGEVAAAVPIVRELDALLPEVEIILSTTTVTGQAVARRSVGERAVCVFAPVDLPAAAALALQTARPDLLVLVETEIWPNWLYLARRAGIRTIMVNGRLSVRSARGYRRIRSLVGPVLAGMDAFSMIGQSDAARLKGLGVPIGKIAVNGNAKYDHLAGMTTAATRNTMAALYNLAKAVPVLVAGSVRRGEEALLLDTFLAVRETVPDLVCIIAPRHMPRAAKIAARAGALDIDFQMRSGLRAAGSERRAPLVILDTLGELQATYSMATVVFCGGSLVPLGGQNVLEAAAWGKPVLFGPSMEDFQAEKELLIASGGGREVADQQELIAWIRFFLTDREAGAQAGRAGRAMVRANTGAAGKHAEVVLKALA